MRIEVTRSVVEAIMRQAKGAQPAEACGILLGANDWIDRALATRNVHPTPATHFEIDPQELVDAHRQARQGGPEVIGYYHSHPTGDCSPSETDRATASGDGRIWAIVGSGELAFWRDDPNGFAPLSYDVVDG